MDEIPPPFYGNPDNTHCFQCSLYMALAFFDGSSQWNFEDIIELTGKKEGAPTWPMKSYVELHKIGYDLVIYDPMNYEDFIENPKEYFIAEYGEEYASYSFATSDIEAEVGHSRKLLSIKNNLTIKQHSYTSSDVKRLLDEGYLCVSWVDHNKVWGLKGKIAPHMVLVYGYDQKNFLINDPGGSNPRYKKQGKKIPYEVFELANRVNEKGATGEFLAIRPKDKK